MLNNARHSMGGSGTVTAALSSAGDVSTTAQSAVESWNGSSWTEVNDVNTARSDMGSAGTSTLALIFGGITLPSTTRASTESWNGTNWTNENDINTARQLTGDGTQTAAIAFGGDTGSASSATEEWNGDGITTQTID